MAQRRAHETTAKRSVADQGERRQEAAPQEAATPDIALPQPTLSPLQSFLQNINAIVDHAGRIIDLDAYWPVGRTHYYHIKGAIECFRTHYSEDMPEVMSASLPDGVRDEHQTKNMVRNLLEIGEKIGELRLARTVLERDAPDVWSQRRPHIVESERRLERLAGLYIAFIQSSFIKRVSDELYMQHDAIMDLIHRQEETERIVRDSTIAAYLVSYRTRQQRLDRLVDHLGLEQQELHGTRIYLPSDISSTLEPYRDRILSSLDDAMHITMKNEWYTAETGVVILHDELVQYGRGLVGGLLRLADAANIAKEMYIGTFDKETGAHVDMERAEELFLDFAGLLEKYAAIRLFNRMENGAYAESVRGMEDALTYHFAEHRTYFNRCFEHALQLQLELGYDSTWAKKEFAMAKSLVREVLRDHGLIKGELRGEYCPHIPVILSDETKRGDELLDGIDDPLLIPSRGLTFH
jgi:hypothetical protein